MTNWVKFESGQELYTMECPSWRKILDTEDDLDKLKRCKDLFEKYCIVTESIRKGLSVNVDVVPEID